jgi:hypothetical protein
VTEEFLKQVLKGWNGEKGGNFWNLEFAERQYKNGTGFLSQELSGVKHAGVVLMDTLLAVGGASAVRRMLKGGVVGQISGILLQTANKLAQLKTIQAREKRLKLKGALVGQAQNLVLAEKKTVMESLETDSPYTADTLRFFQALFLRSCQLEDGIHFDDLTVILEPIFAHPLPEIQAILLPFLKELTETHPQLYQQAGDSFPRVLVYAFGVLKRRNFQPESYGFGEFMEFLATTANHSYPETLESIWQVLSKVAVNASVG